MKVMVFGVFDLFHYGHLSLLQRAKTYGDRLEVYVMSDELTFVNKGKKPIINERERSYIVSALKCVDYVEVVDSYPMRDIRDNADIVIHGDDHFHAFSMSCTYNPLYIPHTEGISTTEIIERCKNAEGRKSKRNTRKKSTKSK